MLLIPRVSTVETELTSAYTFDVITSDIFLNILFTVWTFFSILLKPIFIIFLLVGYLLPILYLLTISRFMRLFLTFKTIPCTTKTLDVILLNHYWFLTKIVAIIWWTIAYILIPDRVVYAHFFLIHLNEVWRYIFDELHDNWAFFTFRIHAWRKYFIF